MLTQITDRVRTIMMRYRVHIILSFVGALCGYLLLHPYTMLVYTLIHLHQDKGLHFHWQDLPSRTLAAFDPMMLPMAVSFAFFGGVVGLLAGILLDRKRRLIAAEHENKEKIIALDTLKEVMVTLSHYLLNANMIIGGKVRHCRKATDDKDILAALAVVEEQGRKIDAVISALRDSTEIKVESYTSDGVVKMIDISREIEDRIEKTRVSAS